MAGLNALLERERLRANGYKCQVMEIQPTSFYHLTKHSLYKKDGMLKLIWCQDKISEVVEINYNFVKIEWNDYSFWPGGVKVTKELLHQLKLI